MQGEDDLRGLAKIMAFMRAVSILLVLMHLYWFCYGFFLERGWTLEVINKILGMKKREIDKKFDENLFFSSGNPAQAIKSRGDWIPGKLKKFFSKNQIY